MKRFLVLLIVVLLGISMVSGFLPVILVTNAGEQVESTYDNTEGESLVESIVFPWYALGQINPKGRTTC